MQYVKKEKLKLRKISGEFKFKFKFQMFQLLISWYQKKKKLDQCKQRLSSVGSESMLIKHSEDLLRGYKLKHFNF